MPCAETVFVRARCMAVWCFSRCKAVWCVVHAFLRAFTTCFYHLLLLVPPTAVASTSTRSYLLLLLLVPTYLYFYSFLPTYILLVPTYIFFYSFLPTYSSTRSYMQHVHVPTYSYMLHVFACLSNPRQSSTEVRQFVQPPGIRQRVRQSVL